MAPTILYEDNHLLAVCKPAGMLSQGDATGDLDVRSWAQADLKARYNKPGEVYCALLHRLDRPVGGVLLLARTSKAADRMTRQFKDRSVRKTYLAITHGNPHPGTQRLEHHLVKLYDQPVVRAYNTPRKGSKPAVLRYRLLGSLPPNNGEDAPTHLVAVFPETGRQHQIRVQLSAIQAPIMGDLKYRAPAPLPNRQIALWAYRLEVSHPTTQEPLTLVAPPPPEAPWQAYLPLLDGADLSHPPTTDQTGHA